ncbi:hypothetical protein [Actinacidiphila acididurans]|uniref:Uncharacterized protein n=1 Tax=Actinacidiphila acididurans TaxID=2784346 RepID=A0ABS2TVR4_9ACTN|nr:hypothetical protein [Actinacidiphila acididurans]MBM9507439.1 hypothetical protein [Actinacidiphila acididurans]
MRRRNPAVAAAVLALGVAGTGAAAATGVLTSSDGPADPIAASGATPTAAATATTTAAAADSPAGDASTAPAAGTPTTPAAAPSAPATTSAPARAAASPAAAPRLTTLAYNAPGGSGGDLVRPIGVSAFQGHVYVSNTPDNVVTRLDGSVPTPIAGTLEGSGENGDGGPASRATLSQPVGTAEDAAGDVYIADTSNDEVAEVTGLARSGSAPGPVAPAGPAS